jgi:hypothetical protein
MIGADGGEYNVDPVGIDHNSPWDSDKVIEYMKNNVKPGETEPYSETEIKLVSQAISRMAELGIIEIGKPKPGYQTW